ncbi:hypothetical protein [Burkholderia cenocepacia]|uniref:hypothetical protein n=1 Tax=Burkholderia cenocepacia TaxID=95486 RepID=UPI000AF1D115|nr:hypothetical protein [Burkholderia cenocepacia]MBR8270703.1 hypothetical protein [Burkholderia cenocepacia]
MKSIAGTRDITVRLDAMRTLRAFDRASGKSGMAIISTDKQAVDHRFSQERRTGGRK